MDGLNEFQRDAIVLSSGARDVEDTMLASCAADVQANGTEVVLSPSLHNGLKIFQIIYTFILLFSGTLLNSLVIFLIVKFRELKTVSFGIVFQISVINLGLSLVCGITILITQFAGGWIMGIHFCVFIGFMLFSFSYLRTLLIFVFVLDKFLFVFAPFFYPKYSDKIVAVLCAVFWTVSLLHSLIFIPGILDCYDFLQPAMTCFFSPECNKNCKLFYYITPITVSPGIIVSVILFFGLYIKGRRLHLKILKIMPKEECKISKKDWRALNTFALLCSAVFVVTLPPFITVLICQSVETSLTGFLAIIVAMNVSFLHVIIDPVILTRNADLKRCYKKLIKKLSGSYHRRILRASGNSTTTAIITTTTQENQEKV